MKLIEAGWDKASEKSFKHFKKQGLKPGRILNATRRIYHVYCEDGVLQAQVSGRFQHRSSCKSDYPKVGDWVAVCKKGNRALVEGVLPRRSVFSRNIPGKKAEEQVIAANIDHLCIVCGLDGGRNFNLRSIERYLAMAKGHNIHPVIVLNKVDLCSHREEAVYQVRSIAENLPIHLVSAHSTEGIRELKMSFGLNTTAALVGSSGVGKSALVNAFLGKETQTMGHQREKDFRGRHTTTSSELFFLNDRAMVIDTPGLREMQPWKNKDGLETCFGEIYEAARHCRYRDCSHQGEPDCAVQQLLIEGRLDLQRYQNFLDMQNELV